MLTSSAKTAILLNGISGPWIQIKRGLRQGEPLFPHLFLIIVDIIQKVIQGFSKEGWLNHLLVLDLSCPIIQCTDDTLIIFQGDLHQTQLHKKILDAFSLTTGLLINYDKSTLVPINLDNEYETQIANILGCPIASFPKTYLGIPLSDSKLPKWALFPILQSLDKRIDTLAISRATSGGRLTLSKLVLSALPSHILACINAPKWFLQEINKRRHAYFWSGHRTTLGAHCKVAWDIVCRSIEEGSLNVKNLEIQNICLLLKFIHKLHMPNKRSWVNWILSWVYGRQKRLGDNISRCTSSWHYLMTLIDLYRSLTFVRVGNGRSTCFWLDSWLGNKPLLIQYPALFSDVQSPNVTVADCISEHG
jgi:hypothetical protein